MRVALETRALTTNASGIKTYVEQLVKNLHAVSPEHEFVQLASVPRSDLGLFPWMFWSVPGQLASLKPDVVHFTKAAVPLQKEFPTVVTIYDVIPLLLPESQSFSRRLYWPATLRHAAKTADHILTISEASKRDIVEHLQVSPDKVTVTSLAVNPSFRAGETPGVSASWRRETPGVKEASVQEPYILFVGTRDQRKNIPLLIRAFSQIAQDIPHRLVIAGKPALKIDDTRATIERLSLADRVEVRDFVPHGELPALYADADLFVYPSVYEGWGFPPQEAMASGVPVIISDGGSLPEVVGSAGEVVKFAKASLIERMQDTVFEEELAQRMVAILTDPQKRQTMVQQGLEQVKKFTWEQVALKTVEVYKKVAR